MRRLLSQPTSNFIGRNKASIFICINERFVAIKLLFAPGSLLTTKVSSSVLLYVATVYFQGVLLLFQDVLSVILPEATLTISSCFRMHLWFENLKNIS